MTLETNFLANIIIHLDHTKDMGEEVDRQYVRELCEVGALYLQQAEGLGLPWHRVVEDWKRVHPERAERWG